ncbi:MAG: NeuD/PglB/VioB family sugar acetyltransferase [Sedimenticola sp.]|nr:NeuD/PglB/VioB family sugar acetyltransferase [Sedimenticola sp.]
MITDVSLPAWYIYGAGGLGLETMDILTSCINSGTVPPHACSFLVDNPEGKTVNGYPLVSFTECDPTAKVTIAVGEPEIRSQLAEKCLAKGLVLSTLVSPHAYVSDSAVLDEGVVIAPFVSVQASAKISRNVAVNTQAIVGHHVTVSEHAVISSQVNLGGASAVGAKSYVGMGVLVRELLTIGESSIVGMGSVVHRDIPDGVIAIGNPARPAKRNENKRVFS